MEEKKQTKKWSYSSLGKGFRGFLCMVTFIVFCVSTVFTIFVTAYYGTEIFTNPKKSYYETDMYQIQLFNEMTSVLNYIDQQDVANEDDAQVAILHMADNSIHYYDKVAMGETVYYDYDYGSRISDLEEFEVGKPLVIKDKDLSDFDELKHFLEFEALEVDYIYFDEEAFKALFQRDGLINTNHRFSEDFSEDAYFVFKNYEVTKTRREIEAAEQEEDTSESEEATTELADYEMVEEAEDTTVVRKEIVMEKEEVIITPYNLTAYAVYDPENDLFYSTGDDYFEEMDSYIYGVSDVFSQLEEIAEGDSYYNSIVIPLLRSYNIGVYEILYSYYSPYEAMMWAEQHLSSLDKEGIFYYLKIDEDTSYTNIEDDEPESAIMNLEHYYRFDENDKGKLVQTHSSNVPDFTDAYNLEESFARYSKDFVFCFGFRNQETVLDPTSTTLVKAAYSYNWIVEYSKSVVILVVVSFLLLMMQAIWLIYTTGRRFKGDTEVKLNHFDRWYTEIWAIVVFVIMTFAILCGIGAIEEMGNQESLGIACIYAAIGALPFGFFFMVLTLSFARRLKAHNILNRFLVVKLGQRVLCKVKGADDAAAAEETKKEPSAIAKACASVWNRCKEKYYSIKGTRKLLLVFIIFLIVETIVVFIGMNNDIQAVPAFMYFLLLQALALVALVWVIRDIEKLAKGVEEITKGNLDSKVAINEKVSILGELADGVNHIGDGLKSAVETSLKDERMKTELITNVSHDLKTPLTSIINYVDLLKKQEMPNDDAKHYVEVLDGKAQRLKQLTEDLVEAAKATSGNLELEMMPLTFDELMKQALGEFEDKFEKKKLTIVASYPKEPAVVMADGRRLFRIIENVLQNIYKYAMEGTRVYADLSKDADVVTFTLKNVSAAPLNISPDELMERFTRGDSSRTTEGSGLGLSIAKDLTRLQNGEFEIQLDGDLFKVVIRFPEHKQS